jgi:hypothetical protein
MKMRSPRALLRFLATALVVVAGTAVVGHAAGLGVSSHAIGAGLVTITRCGTAAAITVTETGGATITGLSLTNIPSSCAGASLTATLNGNGGTTSTATGIVPAGGGTLALTLTTHVPLTQAGQVDIVMTGT